jgi:hypothetical protein
MLNPNSTVVGVGSDRDHQYWVVMLGYCNYVSADVCAATGDFGDATGDIQRWELEDSGQSPPTRQAASAPKKSSGMRVLSSSAKGRTFTMSVSMLRAAQGTLSVGATGCCTKTTARQVARKTSGSRVIYTYRVRVHKRGRYQLWASFSGRGAWTDGHAERWYDIS